MFRVYFCLCLHFCVFTLLETSSLEFVWNFSRWMNEESSATHLFTQEWMSIGILPEQIWISWPQINYTRWINNWNFQFSLSHNCSQLFFTVQLSLKSKNWFPLFWQIARRLQRDPEEIFQNTIQFSVWWVLSQFKQNSRISSFKQTLAQVPLKLNDKTVLL